MRIAVIGATGNMGSALTKAFAKSGHEVFVFAQHKDKLSAFAEAVKKEFPKAKIVQAKTAVDAAKSAEIIVPAVWYALEKEVANAIRKEATGKIVVSISNPLNSTYDDLVTPASTSAAEEMAKTLPDSKIVKAFNTAFAGDYAAPVFSGIQADIFVAGDDEKAVETVSKLVKDAGFNPLNAGKLSASRILERMTVLLIQLSNKHNYNWIAGWKVLHK